MLFCFAFLTQHWQIHHKSYNSVHGNRGKTQCSSISLGINSNIASNLNHFLTCDRIDYGKKMQTHKRNVTVTKLLSANDWIAFFVCHRPKSCFKDAIGARMANFPNWKIVHIFATHNKTAHGQHMTRLPLIYCKTCRFNLSVGFDPTEMTGNRIVWCWHAGRKTTTEKAENIIIGSDLTSKPIELVCCN